MQKTGSPCSSLSFALHKRSEFLVGMADRSLKCFDAGRYCSVYDVILLFCLCGVYSCNCDVCLLACYSLVCSCHFVDNTLIW